ncbi:hypothetical protein SCD_n02251 [Sulfuricella denitrificans skB26]|uniref:Uncharacterized protein n=1 Tax=Sulfuricella denitrificans (strain DSM 22764 / NBRC 105220 / skB26) TaxID=1163617 RepID=S6AMM2_SULDS|nr:hypothetical protein [Sulfuricella denitrificans]BAN36059.1 hypothetical protein SCD_n02251 [Sulfuricella denitrificans skB26]
MRIASVAPIGLLAVGIAHGDEKIAAKPHEAQSSPESNSGATGSINLPTGAQRYFRLKGRTV